MTSSSNSWRACAIRMCHLAMLEGTGAGDGTTWLEPVTDDPYRAANQR